MPLVTRLFGRAVSLALFGDHMDQDRPFGAVLNGAQNGQKLAHVMAINRPNI